MQISTKQLLSTLGLVFAATVFCTATALQGASQAHHPKDETHQTAHTDDWELYESLSPMPPVKVMSVEGNTLYYAAKTRQTVKLGSVELEPNYSIVPKGFSSEKHGGCYGIMYCRKHLVVLRIDELPEAACR